MRDTLSALKVWRESLVGLDRRSRLIRFKPPRTSSLTIDSPTPDEILANLQSGKPQSFVGDVTDPETGGVTPARRGGFLHVSRLDSEIGPVARNLMRRANEEFLDRGLSVLYVAFGMLRWLDVDGSDMASPIYLVPVELVPEGPRATPRLKGGEDDAVLNPALPLRIADFGIIWPTLEELEGLSITEILDLFHHAIAKAKDFKEWSLEPEVHLATFSFTKEAMYKDLLDNEEVIANHPVVQALANIDPTRQTEEFQFDPLDPAVIDEAAPPEKTPLVLDADSSQRAAVAAALAGRSFVMDGPPGTGKSQTIANMVGALMHAGKSVLFVSEKIAALDVVRNRLRDVGLGSYLLELHSHKANRKDVAVELLTTLDNVAQPPRGMAAPSRAALEDRRRKLNVYAIAMNETRSPLQASLHDVIGVLADLVHVPTAPVPKRPPLKLDEAGLAKTRETLSRLERTWRPATQGTSFLWRDVRDDSSLESRLWQARAALEELQGTVNLNRDVADAFGLSDPRTAHELVALLKHQHADRPLQARDEWLAVTDWVAIEEDRKLLGDLVSTYREAARQVENLAGVPYKEIPENPPPLIALRPSEFGVVDFEPLTAAALRTAADSFEARSGSLAAVLRTVEGLGQVIGVPMPVSYPDVDRVVRLVELRAQDARIEPSWLSATGLQAAKDAASALRVKALALDAAEDRASLYKADALSAPLRDLQDRFANLHTGLRRLSASYRSDKRAVAALLGDAKQVKSGIARLSDAIAWSDASGEFESSGIAYGPAIGKAWSGRQTDWDALDAAFEIAGEVLAVSGGTVSPATIAYFTSSSFDASHRQITDTARAELDSWRASLAPAPAVAARPELLVEPIEGSIAWLSTHVIPMREAAERIEAVDAVTGKASTLAEIEAILVAASVARRAAAALETAESTLRPQFGGLYGGSETDLEAADEVLAWTLRTREFAAGPLSPAQVSALASSVWTDALPEAIRKWESALGEITGAFGPSRGEEFSVEFGTFDSAYGLLRDLEIDTVGQQEWFDYKAIRSELAELDLDSTVEFCIAQRVASRDVPKVIERALLRGWVDAQIKGDERLHPLLAGDRESLVEEFRKLDRELVAAATSDIVRAANTRRPSNTSIGEPALIRREGMKQRRHMAVRSLIGQARSATQAIKPVFMMSPLAVSQYLPPDINFDVVIFDEASQVTPGDSINCIYRGRSFILAGDDKQLPPTQFFERLTESEDVDELESDVKDFQSILELAKSSGAFRNLGLRWHYRSRHEALIAFSNYRFYEGHLVTYPSAQEEGADVGVEFFLADGLYRRGGGADNPKEAKVVAERVIHHYRTRPELSLGVVTFSVAQADAVVAAVDELRASYRDLDGYFDKTDRLNGFFVRSLESVQGDERDVIIFSIGYGPDEAGRISTNFGVLNKDKGWRRLNVGVTRARQRVEVIASMEAGDIPPSTNENVEALRAYLDFARRGIGVLGTQASATGLMPESPFEESVIRVIESWGYLVEPQVGAAGFRIDLGVRHPAHPGAYAIGVECDGYQYHSAPAARDRDRLRDQVLEGLGWTLHRIWGTAWYRDRATEENRLRAAIEAAVSGPQRQRQRADIQRSVVETVPAETDDGASWVVAYTKAEPVALPRWVQPAEPGNHLHLVEPIKAIARAEGPVHMETVSERIREWWDIGRVSSRLRDNLDLAIRRAALAREGDFIDIADRPVSRVRSIDQTRKPEHIHLDEFALASELLVRDVGGASRDEVIIALARLFGWGRTGAIVEDRLNQAIDRAVRAGRLEEIGGMLSFAAAAGSES